MGDIMLQNLFFFGENMEKVKFVAQLRQFMDLNCWCHVVFHTIRTFWIQNINWCKWKLPEKCYIISGSLSNKNCSGIYHLCQNIMFHYFLSEKQNNEAYYYKKRIFKVIFYSNYGLFIIENCCAVSFRYSKHWKTVKLIKLHMDTFIK